MKGKDALALEVEWEDCSAVMDLSAEATNTANKEYLSPLPAYHIGIEELTDAENKNST